MEASQQISERVTRLERTNRLLLGAVVVMGAMVLAAYRSAPADDFDIVRAQRIQLIDESGTVRIDLRHDSTETGLFVMDSVGDTRIGVAQFAHGGGGYALHGPGGKGAAVLYLKGSGSLSFYDSAGGVTARVP